MEFPLGLCPPVLIWSIFKYSHIAETAPVRDDSSGALSVRSDLGTPLWKIMFLIIVFATLSCVLVLRCVSIASLVSLTAPVKDDSSGALSVRSDLGTPLWKIMFLLSSLRHYLAF